ncbi:NAD(P)-binding protein [Aspergillus brunneoviolaceus CBS 621.78]|uniref:Uncharacterized protein n=1 Tax=Aspergillus brunneoviolaceus CBS 621.78 TaxID=1450534 RepID=A0ACD1G1Y1_9EURO|nr:hypothetical protein BO95DRAFT_466178 [Aspergillus brunneoviolaceus CBS 621.78]RAH43192.1 hypothetical protein BO95DRAFT_466178 [Aspergillus brunneoviolaceus CBS 621.78]
MHTILSLFLTSLLVTIAQSTTPTLAGDIDIIERDVAIIGGGAGGTYCAISLQDQAKSVIVIDKEYRLGGHVETYVDPGTGIAMDYGVALFENTSVVNDYFARFDIPLVKISQFNITWSTYDFRTGKAAVLSYNPSREEVLAAFATYFAQLARYPELEQGIFLSNPIPEDLCMPFGRFVDKYKIHAAVPTMFLLNAGKLLIAIPPNPSLLDPWLRLNPTEHSLFTRYISTGLYVGLVNGTRLPPTAGILNLAPNHTMYSFSYLPDTYSLIPARLPGLKLATYGSLQTTDPFPISEAAVRHHMLDDIRRIHRENPDRFPGTNEPAFVAFAAHAPYNLQVSGEDIENGFYERLYALQGEMNTFWTGSAWAADISGDIWKVSRGVVLPMLVGEL